MFFSKTKKSISIHTSHLISFDLSKIETNKYSHPSLNYLPKFWIKTGQWSFHLHSDLLGFLNTNQKHNPLSLTPNVVRSFMLKKKPRNYITTSFTFCLISKIKIMKTKKTYTLYSNILYFLKLIQKTNSHVTTSFNYFLFPKTKHYNHSIPSWNYLFFEVKIQWSYSLIQNE